jgi:hypothetical protein
MSEAFRRRGQRWQVDYRYPGLHACLGGALLKLSKRRIDRARRHLGILRTRDYADYRFTGRLGKPFNQGSWTRVPVGHWEESAFSPQVHRLST